MRCPPAALLIATTVAWAGLASAQVNGRQVAARANAQAVAPTSSVRSLWVLHCVGCHGMDGSGSRIGQVPDMRSLGELLRTEGGRSFVISVPGVMGSGLTDQQVADVTNWVLATIARGSVPEDHRPYDAREVAEARATPLVDVAAARARLIAQAPGRAIAIGVVQP